jgi:hypothetical protein
VGLLVAPQAEASAQVRLEVGDLLDVGHERLVDLLLVLDPLGISVLLLGGGLAVLEEVVLALALLLLARPVGVLADAVEDLLVGARNVDDGAGCDHVAVVDAAQGHAVGLEGARDEQDALLELAKQHNALAAETAGQEDEDGAGGEGFTVLGGVGGLAGLGSGQLAVRGRRSVLVSTLACSLRADRNKHLRIPSSSAPPPRQGSTWMPFARTWL